MDYLQGKILFLLKLLEKIDSIASRGYISASQKEKIALQFQKELESAHKAFFTEIKNSEELEIILERTLALHALEIEKSFLLHLFNHHEIPEWILRRMMNKLDSQIERIEDGKTQIKDCYEHKLPKDILSMKIENFVQKFGKKRNLDEEKYIKARTRMIILEKVLSRFEIFRSVEEIAESKALADVIARYE